jgi:hypothetical protein
MNKDAIIILRLNHVDQLIVPPRSLIWGRRFLMQEAEDYIIEEAETKPHHTSLVLKIYLPGDFPATKNEITEGIHEHFTYRRKKSQQKLKQALQLGWKFLLIAIIFLAILIVVVSLLPESILSLTVREVLIILGWVALWRPADLLLYEWRPYKREMNLFRRLEESTVEVRTE